MGAIAILGATGGLGSAITERIAQRAPVIIGYHRNAEKAQAACAAIARSGGQASALQVDMTQGESLAEFLARGSEIGGGLSGIVSATGPAIPLCPLEEVSDEDFDRIYRTDVRGSFNVLKRGGAALKASGGGPIVVFLTTAVLRTLENDGMSGGPKTAVAGLLRQTARELGPFNVRVNGVAPGVIDAGIVHDSFEVNQTAKDVIASCMNQTPLKRMGKPEEVAALVDFLLSPDAAYISGQIIAVDGGYSA